MKSEFSDMQTIIDAYTFINKRPSIHGQAEARFMARVLFVRSDFWKKEDKELYQSVKSNYKYIVGLCSYQSFPGPIINPYEYGRPTTKKEDRFIYQYPQDICAWCNCFSRSR